MTSKKEGNAKKSVVTTYDPLMGVRHAIEKHCDKGGICFRGDEVFTIDTDGGSFRVTIKKAKA